MRDNGITSGQEPNINTAQNNLSQNNGSHCTGNIKVIGIGPGDEEFMTPQAREAILAADRVVDPIATTLSRFAGLAPEQQAELLQKLKAMKK